MADKGISVFTHNGEDYNINDPNIAGEFYPNSNYAVGDHVTHEGKLYVFTAAHTGAWTGTDVTQVQIGAELHDYGAHAMVRYDVAQTLTDAQKAVARSNIAAANAELEDKIGAVPSGTTVENQIFSQGTQISTNASNIDALQRQVGTVPTGETVEGQIGDLKSAIDVFEPAATSEDVGKTLVAKTVTNGKVSEYELATIEPGLSDAAKEALLACFEHIALWTDGNGQKYYDDLYDALYGATPPAPDRLPDFTTGVVGAGYYDNTGAVAPNFDPEILMNYYNEKYFPIDPSKTYIWVQGFEGASFTSNNVFYGNCKAYRVCYYDSSKEFISREVDPRYSSAFGFIEPRYFMLTPPSNAAFIRVSWKSGSPGYMYEYVPTDLYAVTLILANLDDSEIPSNTNIVNGFDIIRNGESILNDVIYGNSDVAKFYNFSDIPESYNGAMCWVRNVFNILQGGSPEEGSQNNDTLTRIQNNTAFLVKRGDIIRFNGVKAAVRAERIWDGHLQYTTSWITDNSDFVIGGE